MKLLDKIKLEYEEAPRQEREPHYWINACLDMKHEADAWKELANTYRTAILEGKARRIEVRYVNSRNNGRL